MFIHNNTQIPISSFTKLYYLRSSNKKNPNPNPNSSKNKSHPWINPI